MPEIIRFVVEEKYDGTNAGRYLRTVCKLSARTLALLKRTEGSLLSNGKLLRSVDKVYAGNIVEIHLPSEENTIVPVKGELDVLYEDSFLVIVNKPHSMPVHPVKVHQEDTLANVVAYRYRDCKSEFVFRAVNRLDRDTSGIVIIAKDRHTASLMQKTDIDKHYLAVCHGVTQEIGTVDKPIAIAQNSKIVRCVCDEGQSAITHYQRIKSFSDATILNLTLETGRTHQIRCHMSYLGHPLFGDDLYGGSRDLIKRQALHCTSVSFIHPFSGERVDVKADMPDDIQSLIYVLTVGDIVEESKK